LSRGEMVRRWSILIKRLGLVDETSGGSCKALIVDHVALGHGVSGVTTNGTGWLGSLTYSSAPFSSVGGSSLAYPRRGSRACGLGCRGRPGIKVAPDIEPSRRPLRAAEFFLCLSDSTQRRETGCLARKYSASGVEIDVRRGCRRRWPPIRHGPTAPRPALLVSAG